MLQFFIYLFCCCDVVNYNMGDDITCVVWRWASPQVLMHTTDSMYLVPVLSMVAHDDRSALLEPQTSIALLAIHLVVAAPN